MAKRPGVFSGLMPRMGEPGSRSTLLHGTGNTHIPDRPRLSYLDLTRFGQLRWLGTLGMLLISLGGLGAGALPVIDNPYAHLPFGRLMSRMLQTSSVIVLVGVGLLVLAWVLMAPYVGASKDKNITGAPLITLSTLRRTWIAWVLPIVLTAPLFTQDIYSYLAQGAIVSYGLDPYAAGPVQILGPEHHLARSVPFIWANSPSPYGPIALGIAAAINVVTRESIFFGVLAHRLVAVIGLMAAGWAITKLARRCDVRSQTAVWLGILNPLALLHLIGGIHNESIMLGLSLVGMELGLRGVDAIREVRIGRASASAMQQGLPSLSTTVTDSREGTDATAQPTAQLKGPRQPSVPTRVTHPSIARHGWGLIVASGVLISMSGMVKVTGFIALGFVGMALARMTYRTEADRLRLDTRHLSSDAVNPEGLSEAERSRPNNKWSLSHWFHIARAIAVQATVLVLTAILVGAVTGIGFGWVTGQGGAATIRSWMSITTDLGVISGWAGMLLGLGDHTEMILVITRGIGIAISLAFMVRMLIATFRGTISPVGGFGVSTFLLVVLFPVVHPWYMLWAILPLAAWANQNIFRYAAIGYSAIMCFFVLPRGLALPPGTIFSIYVASLIAFITVIGVLLFARNKLYGPHM